MSRAARAFIEALKEYVAANPEGGTIELPGFGTLKWVRRRYPCFGFGGYGGSFTFRLPWKNDSSYYGKDFWGTAPKKVLFDGRAGRKEMRRR